MSAVPLSGPPAASPRRSNPSPPRSTSRPSATPPTWSSDSDRAPAGNGVALPDGPAYFTSRGSVMGRSTRLSWPRRSRCSTPPSSPRRRPTAGPHRCRHHLPPLATRAPSPSSAASSGTSPMASIAPSAPERAIEPLRPEAGRCSSGPARWPCPAALGVAWRLGDMLREYRGDRTSPRGRRRHRRPRDRLMTELYWGLPPRSYLRTRAWSTVDLDEARSACDAGPDHGGRRSLTEEGRTGREAVEDTTDQMAARSRTAGRRRRRGASPSWSRGTPEIRAAGGYLPSGPHEVSRPLRSTAPGRRLGLRRPELRVVAGAAPEAAHVVQPAGAVHRRRLPG